MTVTGRSVAARLSGLLCGSLGRAVLLASVLGGDSYPAVADELLSYRTEITGDAPSAVVDTFKSVSSLVTLEARLPRTQAILRRRLIQDEERLATILRSEGYYAHRIEGRIERPAEEQGEGLLVTLDIAAGELFTLTAYDVSYRPGAASRPEDIPLDQLDVALGEPARAADIVAAEGLLLRRLREAGYAYPQIVERRYLVDHAAQGLRASLTVDTGPSVTFGDLTISGLESVEEDYVRRLVAWPRGADFDQSEIERVRAALVRSNLFDGVTVKAAETAAPDGSVPVTAELVERPHRSIGANVGFSTDELGKAGVFWEHRNFFGQAERLRAELEGSFIRQSALLAIRKPQFLTAAGALIGRLEVANETGEAFEGQTATAELDYEHRFSDVLTGSGGIAFDHEDFSKRPEDDVGVSQTISLPFSLSFDNRDDVLNPTEGLRAEGGFVPAFASSQDEGVSFVTNSLSVSGYQSFFEGDRLVLAGRVGAASIFGAERAEIPAAQRLYAGGGGSVRGYTFRSLGPLDSDEDPLGGRSRLEFSMEARVRVTEDIGVVPFIDGGGVSEDELQSFSDRIRWAAGLGLRYHTAVGPLRFDVAVPLNSRESDEDFQFYISLGQAF